MYLKDFDKHLIAIFFGIGIAEEASFLFNVNNPILSLIYTLSLFLIVINYTKLKGYFWPPALGLIGIFALIHLISLIIGYKENSFHIMSSIVSLLVWIRCIKHLGEDQSENDNDEEIKNDNDQIINGNENIGKI